jgi:hypothetical protein
MKAYYTLCLYDKQHGAWSDEFGDYSRSDVEAELEGFRDSGVPARFLKIIKTPSGDAAAMMAARDALPSARVHPFNHPK